MARVVGDGVMAVWGYPSARDDDPLRAVRAAVRIRDGLAHDGRGLAARIGVNTGEATVAFGDAEEDADDVMGDAVNIAARLSTSAEPGTILIGASTASLVGEHAQLGTLRPYALKGKRDPALAAVVGGLSDGAARQATGPFVGRREEATALLDAFERVRSLGRPARWLVVGEPGVGKSRLLGEVRRQLAATSAAWATGRCRADTVSPGAALADILKAQAGIADDDDPSTVRDRLTAWIGDGASDGAWLTDRLGALVGLPTSGMIPLEEHAAAWARLLSRIAATGPAVIEIEDVHWADPDLVAFLTGPALEGAGSVLVLATGRPEALDGQPSLAGLERLALETLPEASSGQLVAELAPSLPAETRQAIADRGGGNPLFLGELVRLVVDRGGDASALPDSLQSVIGARLDRLGPAARTAALDAAVIGEAFPRGALAALGLPEARLDEALGELVRADLVRPRSGSTLTDEVEYAFRHALVRDAAYGRLTRADRAVRHAATARWFGDRAGPSRGDLTGAVADHDLRALALAAHAGSRIDVPALRVHARAFLERAAEHAAILDVNAAVARLRQAQPLLDDDADRLRVGMRLVPLLVAAGDHADAMAESESALAIARTAGDARATARILIDRTWAAVSTTDDAGPGDANAAIAILEGLPPDQLLVDAYESRSLVDMFRPTDADLQHWSRKAVLLADEIGSPPPIGALSRLGFALAEAGDPVGVAHLERAVGEARRRGDPSAEALALSDLGGAHRFACQTPEAEAAWQASVEVAETHGLRATAATSLRNLAYAESTAGRLRDALETLDRAATLGVESQDPWLVPAVDFERAMNWLDLGDGAAFDAAVERVAAATRGSHLWPYRGLLLLIVRAGLRGDRAGAGALAEEMIGGWDFEFDERLGFRQLPLMRALAVLRIPGPAEVLAAHQTAACAAGRLLREAHLGLAALAAGDDETASRHLADAGSRFEAGDLRVEAAHARRLAGMSLLRLGEGARGIALLDLARGAYVALGAQPGISACEAALANTPA